MSNITRALWVGGPPGKTFQKIAGKLEEDGILVVAKQSDGFTGVPTDVRLVMANMDMLDHTSFNAAKAAAKEAGIPFVAARLDYTRTRIGLVQAGVVDATPTAALAVAEATEAFEAAAVENPEEALRALLRSLPLDLVRLAQQEAAQAVQDREREARRAFIDAAVEAFRALPSQQAVIEFVEALTDEERAGLSVLLR